MILVTIATCSHRGCGGDGSGGGTGAGAGCGQGLIEQREDMVGACASRTHTTQDEDIPYPSIQHQPSASSSSLHGSSYRM